MIALHYFVQKGYSVKHGFNFSVVSSDIVEDLKNGGYVTEFNGYYLAKSRYLWPVSGRFSIYIHGGLSLMECFVPVLEVEK